MCLFIITFCCNKIWSRAATFEAQAKNQRLVGWCIIPGSFPLCAQEQYAFSCTKTFAFWYKMADAI